MRSEFQAVQRRSRAGVRSLAIVLGAAVALAACDSLLDVPQPTQIPADTFEEPANAELLASGAVSDFDCAYGSYVVMTGLLTDELEDATLTADRWVYDQRNVSPSDRRYSTFDCINLGTYAPMNQARASADRVRTLLEGWTDAEIPTTVNRTSLIATMAAYGGYARVLLGEMFCSGVISSIDASGNIVYGTELTSAQLFASADSAFSLAIDAATQVANDSIRLMATVGRARARLDLGLYAEAAADAQTVAAQVPGFVYNSTASSTTDRRHNRVYDESSPEIGRSSSVDTQYVSMADPRVPVLNTGDSSTTGILVYVQTKYAEQSSPIPIATEREAQLIIAEAQLAAGDVSGAVTTLNTLRQSVGLGPYTGPVTQQDVTNFLIEERRRWFFLEGHRLFDVRRFNITLLPPPGFPYRNGGVYGTTTCLPLPDVERQNNPNLGAPAGS